MPHLTTIADDYLTLFYKFIWFKLRTPDLDNFGKRFFFEVADYQYQIHLLIAFMRILES